MSGYDVISTEVVDIPQDILESYEEYKSCLDYE